MTNRPAADDGRQRRRHPRFDELPLLDGTSERHAWNVFGLDDEVGCLNLIGPQQVIAASREVRRGTIINLNLPLGEPQPQFWSSRPVLRHTRLLSRNVRDDELDSFALQGSTQWDGLGHQRYREFGYYGGRQEQALDERCELGIHRWAERGLIARGVLADVAAYQEARGEPIVPDRRFLISGTLLASVLASQGTALRSGDVLLIRTGWLGWYLGMESGEREVLASRLNEDRHAIALPGLDPEIETISWLWNSEVAALAVDNPTAEALPYDPTLGWAHVRLLALLGLPLGELWQLDELASACKREERYSFLLSAPPLNLPGGVGSPANAYAVL
jgi:hypothetical protein